MTNPTYLAACLEKFENERNARIGLAVCTAQLRIIAGYKKSAAWRTAGRALRAAQAR